MRVFSYFHDEWKADSGRDDENMKVVANKKNNDTIQIDLVDEPTKNQVDQWDSCHQQTRECGRPNDDKNAKYCDEEFDNRFEIQHALAKHACASDNGENEDCRIDRKWYSGLSYNVQNKASSGELF